MGEIGLLHPIGEMMSLAHPFCKGYISFHFVSRWVMALEQERCDLKLSCSGLRTLWASTKYEARIFRHDVHSL